MEERQGCSSKDGSFLLPHPLPGHLSGALAGECSRKCLASLPAGPGGGGGWDDILPTQFPVSRLEGFLFSVENEGVQLVLAPEKHQQEATSPFSVLLARMVSPLGQGLVLLHFVKYHL